MTERQERQFPKKYAPELARIAQGDLLSAKTLAAPGAKGRPENIFLLLHQVIEKSLKAVLIHLGLRVPMVHDLGALLARLPENSNPPFGYEIIELNDFAAIRRYEEGNVILTNEECNKIIDLAEKSIIWTTEALQS